MNTPKLNGWTKILAALIPFLVVFLVAWGGLKSDVANLKDELADKVDETVVVQQYRNIIRELDDIKGRLDNR